MIITALRPEHERAGFHSGVAAFDDYLRHRALRDATRNLAAVFVLQRRDEGVAGFYALSAGSLILPNLLGSPREGATRYPVLPVARLWRLAVDLRHRGVGCGHYMLADALARVYHARPETAAMIAESPTPARGFCLRAGFIAFPDQPARLFYPLRGLRP